MARRKSGRNKNYFGSPHRRYRAPHLAKHVSAVLLELQKHRTDRNEKSYRHLSAIHNVPRSTLMRWHSKLIVDLEWTPASTNWGEHRRIFDDATGLEMA
jgi:hypothetical protein